jgi:nicotinamidase-related amidase
MSAEKFLLNPEECMLLVVDIQDRLYAAMEPAFKETMVKNANILIETAKAFEIPVIVSEQYPKGLGKTIGALNESLKGARKIEKLFFSCYREEPIKECVKKEKRGTVIVSGIETHVCVLQTVLDLLADGYRVVLASDAVCSRREFDRTASVEAMRDAGALIYPTESIAFMLIEKAGTPIFKKLSGLFK